MVPLLGFTPDLDPVTPGVLVDCAHLIPNERAMQSAPSAADGVVGLAALAAECRGAAVLTKLNGSRRTIAGTQTKLYELTGATWTDTGATYTGSTENRWSFAQFGDTSLASNDTEAIQAAASSTFAAIAGAPKARIIITPPNFVVALNTADGPTSAVFGDSPDRWWCSAFQTPTDWAPAVATQCASDRILSGGGEIVAGTVFGTGWVAYKAREMYQATYAGAPAVWSIQRIPGDQGCVGPEAAVDVGFANIFVGEDDIWMYDGARPVPISDGIRQWFFNDLNQAYKYRTILAYDRTNGRVWVFYPSASSTGKPDSAIVYHLARRRWGRSNRTVEAVMNFVLPGITWDTVSSIASSWDAMPNVPWDSQSWQASGRALGFFDNSHNLKVLTGSAENASMTTGDIGDDDGVSFVRAVRLRFFSQPATATVTGQTKMGAGLALAAGATGSIADSRFCLRQTGRFHRFSFSFTGNAEPAALRVDATRAGGR